MSEPSRTEIEAEWVSEQWGRGRTPTTAHPDCICGKPTGETRKSMFRGDPDYQVVGTKATCPQHRPEPKR